MTLDVRSKVYGCMVCDVGFKDSGLRVYIRGSGFRV